MWILQKLPMPPTVNAGHTVSRNRIIKTNVSRAFDRQIDVWFIKNGHKVKRMREEMDEAIKKGFQLKVICYFCFPHENLWTKKNEVKQLDVNNRLKPMCDAITRIISIDDRHFWAHEEEKVECTDEAHVVVAIGPVKPNIKDNLWISKPEAL